MLTVSLLVALVGAATPAPRAAADTTPFRPARYELDLRVDFEEERLVGVVRLTVENASDAPAHTLPLLLYRLMTVRSVRGAEGAPLAFDQRVVAFEDFTKLQVNAVTIALPAPVAPGGTATFEIAYDGHLLGYAETGMRYVQDRIADDYALIRRDAWAYPVVGTTSIGANRARGLPEFDYVARVTVPEGLVVANIGALRERTRGGGTVTYVYANQRPAWRMDFAVGRYAVLERDGHRVFHFPDDSVGAAGVMGALTESLDLYTRWFGPLHGSATFAVIEIPDGWGSQADVTGIIQTAAAFRDSSRWREVYHEVSHLWNVSATEPAPPRWNEGLASFLEYLTAETLHGSASGATPVRERVDVLLAWIRERFAEREALQRIPMIEYGATGNTGLSYSVGMVLFALLHEIVGQERFNDIVGGYYQRYVDSGASTEQFVEHAVAVGGERLRSLFRDWIYTTGWWEVVQAGADFEALAARYR